MKYLDYLYGAYGSNLNMNQMSVRCPNAKPIGSLMLADWTLVFRSVADIKKEKGAKVNIGLWQITEECLVALDRYEGYPHLYGKSVIQVKGVKDLFDTSDVLVYTMKDRYSVIPPNTQYLKSIVNGYEDFNMDIGLLENAVTDSYLNEKYKVARSRLKLL